MSIKSIMAKTQSDGDTAKTRQRPIVHITILLITHIILVRVLCCTAGVLALFLLPVLAKNTYIFENALMPCSVSSMLSYQDISEASRLIKDLTSLHSGAATFQAKDSWLSH